MQEIASSLMLLAMTTGLAVALHMLAAVVWVGGMFFAYMALRPAASSLEPAPRLLLWSRVFERFFRFVWIAIVLLLLTGYWLIFDVFGGFANISMSINLMQGIGIIMMLIYGHVYFGEYLNFKKAVIRGNHDEGARRLGRIRKLVALNLTLGLLTVVIASAGRYL